MKYKVGDRFEWLDKPYIGIITGIYGDQYSYRITEKNTLQESHMTFEHSRVDLETVLIKEKNMVKELVTDVREFVKDNRSVVYTIAIIVLADQFLFKGAFRERLKAIVEKLLCKAEAKVDLVK